MKYLKRKFALAGLVILGIPGVLAVMLKTMGSTVPVALMIGGPCAIGWIVYKRRRSW